MSDSKKSHIESHIAKATRQTNKDYLECKDFVQNSKLQFQEYDTMGEECTLSTEKCLLMSKLLLLYRNRKKDEHCPYLCKVCLILFPILCRMSSTSLSYMEGYVIKSDRGDGQKERESHVIFDWIRESIIQDVMKELRKPDCAVLNACLDKEWASYNLYDMLLLMSKRHFLNAATSVIATGSLGLIIMHLEESQQDHLVKYQGHLGKCIDNAFQHAYNMDLNDKDAICSIYFKDLNAEKVVKCLKSDSTLSNNIFYCFGGVICDGVMCFITGSEDTSYVDYTEMEKKVLKSPYKKHRNSNFVSSLKAARDSSITKFNVDNEDGADSIGHDSIAKNLFPSKKVKEDEASNNASAAASALIAISTNATENDDENATGNDLDEDASKKGDNKSASEEDSLAKYASDGGKNDQDSIADETENDAKYASDGGKNDQDSLADETENNAENDDAATENDAANDDATENDDENATGNDLDDEDASKKDNNENASDANALEESTSVAENLSNSGEKDQDSLAEDASTKGELDKDAFDENAATGNDLDDEDASKKDNNENALEESTSVAENLSDSGEKDQDSLAKDASTKGELDEDAFDEKLTKEGLDENASKKGHDENAAKKDFEKKGPVDLTGVLDDDSSSDGVLVASTIKSRKRRRISVDAVPKTSSGRPVIKPDHFTYDDQPISLILKKRKKDGATKKKKDIEDYILLEGDSVNTDDSGGEDDQERSEENSTENESEKEWIDNDDDNANIGSEDEDYESEKEESLAYDDNVDPNLLTDTEKDDELDDVGKDTMDHLAQYDDLNNFNITKKNVLKFVRRQSLERPSQCTEWVSREKLVVAGRVNYETDEHTVMNLSTFNICANKIHTATNIATFHQETDENGHSTGCDCYGSEMISRNLDIAKGEFWNLSRLIAKQMNDNPKIFKETHFVEKLHFAIVGLAVRVMVGPSKSFKEAFVMFDRNIFRQCQIDKLVLTKISYEIFASGIERIRSKKSKRMKRLYLFLQTTIRSKYSKPIQETVLTKLLSTPNFNELMEVNFSELGLQDRHVRGKENIWCVDGIWAWVKRTLILNINELPAIRAKKRNNTSTPRTKNESASESKSNENVSSSIVNASASRSKPNATASRSKTNASASQSKTNASASKSKSNATASRSKTNASVSQSQIKPTPSIFKSNASSSRSKTNASASGSKTNASASKSSSNASSSKFKTNENASRPKSNTSVSSTSVPKENRSTSLESNASAQKQKASTLGSSTNSRKRPSPSKITRNLPVKKAFTKDIESSEKKSTSTKESSASTKSNAASKKTKPRYVSPKKNRNENSKRSQSQSRIDISQGQISCVQHFYKGNNVQIKTNYLLEEYHKKVGIVTEVQKTGCLVRLYKDNEIVFVSMASLEMHNT